MSEQDSADTPAEDIYAEDESSPADESSPESETATAVADAPVPEEKPLFSDADLEQFDADDVQAGSAIGKMLSIFFLYTVIAMSIVVWWTFRAVS